MSPILVGLGVAAATFLFAWILIDRSSRWCDLRGGWLIDFLIGVLMAVGMVSAAYFLGLAMSELANKHLPVFSFFG